MTLVILGPLVRSPHPDCLREAVAVLQAHGGHAGPHPEETMGCVLSAVRAWEERRHEDREHARRRDDLLRRTELRVMLELAEARKRTRARTALDDVR